MYNIRYVLLHQGKIKFKEHVTKGIDNMPKAFFGFFNGEKIGKAIVQA